MSKFWKYLLASFGVLLLLAFTEWGPWRTLLYRGDGKFSDELFFYPRYWVRFADISLDQPSEHHFHFRGIPNEQMSLILYIKGDHSKWEDRHALDTLPVTIDAKLTDGNGNVACNASGRPADANEDGIWVLMSGPGEAGYWHYQCNFVPVSSFRTYDLMIRVSDVGSNAAKVVVTPTLKGGGIELP
jgi:hypothetical protein